MLIFRSTLSHCLFKFKKLITAVCPSLLELTSSVTVEVLRFNPLMLAAVRFQGH